MDNLDVYCCDDEGERSESFITVYNDPRNRLFDIDNYTKLEFKNNDLFDDIIGVVNYPPRSLDDAFRDCSCVYTESGIYYINVELILGTWLRCIVDRKTRRISAAVPIDMPIQTRCVAFEDSTMTYRERLLFFGKLTWNSESKKYICAFLGTVENRIDRQLDGLAEYMLDDKEERLVTKKWLSEEEESRIDRKGFLQPSLSFFRTNDGTCNNEIFVEFARTMLSSANISMDLYEMRQNIIASLKGEDTPSVFAERPSSSISVFSNKTPSVFGGAPPTSGGRSKEEEGDPSSSSVFVFDQTQKSFTHNEQTQILARLMSHASNKRGSLNGPGPKNMTSRTSRQGQERKSVDNTSPPILSSSVNERDSSANSTQELKSSPQKVAANTPLSNNGTSNTTPDSEDEYDDDIIAKVLKRSIPSSTKSTPVQEQKTQSSEVEEKRPEAAVLASKSSIAPILARNPAKMTRPADDTDTDTTDPEDGDF